jgi:hypothetical protein
MQAIASATAVRPQFATQRKTFNAKKVSARSPAEGAIRPWTKSFPSLPARAWREFLYVA